MMLTAKRRGQWKADFDQVSDELLVSLKVSDDEIEEVATSPHLFAGVKSRIRRRHAETAINRGTERRSISTGLDLIPAFLVPYRSPRWVLTAVGVLLFVAIGLLIVLPQKTSQQVQTVGSVIPQSGPEVEKAEPLGPPSITPEPTQFIAKSHDEAKRPRVRRSNTLSHSPLEEVATDFFPLTFAAESTSEGGHLVRVTIPRSALVAMGLPINVDRAAEHVRADVFIGDDGLARAIRFIQ
jgi:hypothetical protein